MAYTPPDTNSIDFALTTGYSVPAKDAVDFELGEGLPAYTAKSAILDIKNNYGDTSHMLIRSVEFWFEGTKIDVADADITAYSTTNYDSTTVASKAFVTSLSKTGTLLNTSWQSSLNTVTEQRVICVFDTSIEFDTIIVNNGHHEGGYTSRGVEDVKLFISSDSITDTVYGNEISNSTFLFDGSFTEHASSDTADDETLSIASISYTTFNTKSVIIDIADNWGHATLLGIRSVELLDAFGYLIPLVSADMTGYETSKAPGEYYALDTFDTSNSKTGSWVGTQWVSNSIPDKQRIIVVLDDAVEVSDIVVNNSYYSSSPYYTDSGAKNVKINLSTDSITSTVYDEDITNSVKVFDGELTEHTDSNTIQDQILAIAEITPPTFISWNPIDKDSSITLSVDNTVATATTTSWRSLRGLTHKSSGKWYFEIELSTATTANNMGGVMSLDGATDTHMGVSATAWAYNMVDGKKWNNNVQTSYGSPLIEGGILGVAVDLDNGKIWFAEDNVWQDSGDPASGTNFAFDNVTGRVYPGGSVYSLANALTIAGDDINCVYAPPSGFQSWAEAYVPSSANPINSIEEPYNDGGLHIASIELPYNDGGLPIASIELLWDLPDGGLPIASIELLWDLPFPPTAIIEEAYEIAFSVENTIEEIWNIIHFTYVEMEEVYGLKLVKRYNQYYDDKPVPVNYINEYYDDTSLPNRSISLRYKDAVAPSKEIVEFYDDKSVPLKLINMPYIDNPSALAMKSLPYNDRPIATTSKQMPYADAGGITRSITERYEDTPTISKAYTERYSDSVNAVNLITETFDLYTTLELVINEYWSVSSISVVSSFDQSYDLENLNKVTKPFNFPYILVSEASVETDVDITINVNGDSIDFFSVDIDAGMDKYTIIGKIELASEADYLNCPIGSDVEMTIEGVTFNMFIETRAKSKSNTQGISWSIDMISPTAKLDAPYSKTMVLSFSNLIWASDLVQQMADYQGIVVDWDIIDWQIPSYAISANDETPLAVIKKVVNSVGAIIQTKPNGDMLIISRYPVSPTQWDYTVPTVVFSSETDIISISDAMLINDGSNAFLITDQGSSAADISLEEITVDSTTRTIRGFRIPFDDGPFELITSGGDLISISANGIKEAEIPIDFEDIDADDPEEWEYIEFIDWTGKAKYPIYEILEWYWIEDSLGSELGFSEDGTLTVIDQDDNLKESLLKIRYKTKYREWTVRGPLDAYAQVYVPEFESV